MDREQLFQNLSELEKQLKGIKSATEHVNQVVAADRELVRAVNDFSKEASKLIESTRSNFEVEVKAVQKAAVDTLNKSAVDFAAKVQAITSELTTNVSALKNTVDDSIKPMVGETVDVIEHKLKPLVKDEMPKTFSTFMDQYKTLFAKAATEVSSASKLFAEQAGTGVEQLKQVVLAIQGPQEKILSLLDDVKKATEASNEMIHQDVEVSKKAGEDTINATKKIDEISKTISSSIADIQTAIVTNAQNITEYTKDSDVKTRKEISELLTPLQQVPEQLSSLQSIVDSSFLSVNTTLSTIVSKVDTIAKNTKQISTLDTKLSNLRTDVDAQKSVIGQIQTDSKAIKVMLVISLIINACVALGVVLLVASKLKLI